MNATRKRRPVDERLQAPSHLTRAQVARAVGVDAAIVWRRVIERRLPSIVYLDVVMIPFAAVEAWQHERAEREEASK